MSPIEKIANLLVLILLIEMMITVGLGVPLRSLAVVFADAELLVRAGLANYFVVPAIAITLLYLFRAGPMVSAGFLLVAACPGAPFAPSLTGMARGNVSVSVALMVILAGSSAIVAPLCLSVLLPVVAKGANLQIDSIRILRTLSLTQLIPLGVGLLVRSKRPAFAGKLQKPASLLMGLLSIAVLALLFWIQYPTLTQLRVRAFVGIGVLVLLSLLAGWAFGGGSSELRKAVGLTTSARNVGVSLVIATASFPDSVAVTAVIVFALFQIVLVTIVALLWGRLAAKRVPV